MLLGNKRGESMRRFYIFVKDVVLSGYETEEEALREKQRVEEEIPIWKGQVEVLPREHPKIQQYARTHKYFAKREKIKVKGDVK
jgi:hypothetical protein